MVKDDRLQRESILRDFRRARRRAALEAILARLRGSSDNLLPYEEVREKLKGGEAQPRGIKDIPLDAIIGSVGRYPDFTRRFLPRHDSNQDRWARVKLIMSTPGHAGLPPIEVYQIGDAYFVADGNHRVSVAREQGATHIRARVTEIETRVPLTPDDDLDDVILKAEYAKFLDSTSIDTLFPDVELSVTVPGQYDVLKERIAVYHDYMERTREEEVSYTDAVAEWYEQDYAPIVQIIRDRNLLQDFPGRTETDLYAWTLKHRQALRISLGWNVDPDLAADDLADRYSRRPERILHRFGRRLLNALPDELEAGPEPGYWRLHHVNLRQDTRLFADILVAIDGQESGWYAVDQAIALAQQEDSRLKGLHILSPETLRDDRRIARIESEFLRRCKTAGIAGEMAFETGNIATEICNRAEWGDLVVVSISYPPGDTPIERLGSGIRKIVQRCSRPVLTVPSIEVHPIDRVLLAYDGSPKADEALFIAGYIAKLWNISLTVVTVGNDESMGRETLADAKTYLDGYATDVSYIYRQESGTEGKVIMHVARDCASDLILMGGFGAPPVVEMVMGSTVEHVLNTSWKPTLVCR